MKATIVALLFSATELLHAFVPTPAVLQHRQLNVRRSSTVPPSFQLRAATAADESSSDDDATKDTSSSSASCRRSFLVGASGTIAATALSSLQQPALALPDEGTKKQPICVIGCNGRTGSEVVKYLLAENEPIKATS